MRTVAALFVDPKGVYAGLEGVEVWDEARDARLYEGPWPVVAHPPCARWSIMGLCRGYGDGKDGGCFEAALNAVRTYGGVLEHPAHSLAWKRFGLPKPHAEGWTASLTDPGMTCSIDQRWYGHAANKPTWLYLVGVDDPPYFWYGRAPRGDVTVARWKGVSYDQRSRLAAATPPRMATELVGLARMATQLDTVAR